MASKIKKFISSNKFFYILITVLFTQGLWFAATVRSTIPPDEVHHFQFIKYYSQQPISEGPFIGEQAPNTFILGDIERTPSYLYHYSLGSLLKLGNVFTQSEDIQVFLLRVINILLVVGGLIVLRKLLREAGATTFQENIVTGLLVFTGMFVWLSASISYDNALFLLISLFLLLLIRLFKYNSSKAFIGLVAVGSLAMLVKLTFALILTVGLMVFIFKIAAQKKFINSLWGDMKISFQKRRVSMILLLVFAIFSFALFTERYIGNQIEYGSIAPACQTLHTEQECLQNKIYRRSIAQSAAFVDFTQQGGRVIYSPFEFAGDWVDRMYDGLFFYFGHKNISPTNSVFNIFAIYVLSLTILIVMYYKRGSVINTPADMILIFVLIFYVAVLFLFNMNSYLNSGTKYGFQGRYLLPVIPFLYFYLVKAIGSAYPIAAKAYGNKLRYALWGVSLLFIFHHMPLLTFYRGADETWYTDKTKNLNVFVQRALNKTKIAQKGSLYYETERPATK